MIRTATPDDTLQQKLPVWFAVNTKKSMLTKHVNWPTTVAISQLGMSFPVVTGSGIPSPTVVSGLVAVFYANKSALTTVTK